MNTFRLLFLTLLLVALPLKGFSYTTGQIVGFGGLYYKVTSGTKNTLAFIGTDGSKTSTLNLPATVSDGKDVTFTVTSVDYYPGYSCQEMTGIVLPETVTSIEAYALSWAKLNTMYIPKSVTKIADNALCNMGRAPKYTVHGGNMHFEADATGTLYSKGKGKLYSVPSQIPLKSGGVYEVDSKVTHICRGAFLNISGLNKVVLPKDLKTISKGFFTIAPTYSLKEFAVVSGGSTTFHVKDGVLFDGKTLVVYPRGKTTPHYTVPDDIETIDNYAISDNGNLLSVNLNKVNTLLSSAIYNAGKLTTITIPKGIKKYGTVPYKGLLQGCFESCRELKNYVVAAGNTDFVAEDGVLYSADKRILYFYPPKRLGNTYTIATTVTTIAERAFQDAQYISSIFIPQKVKSIGTDAFRSMNSLTKVTFDKESQVNYLAGLAFRGCQKLKEVTLPKGLTSLGTVFYECSNLEVVNVPENAKLTNIWGGAFATNRKLREFNFKGESQLKTIGDNVFAGLTELKAFSIPRSVTKIAANAFIGCKKLAKVTFHDEAVIQEIGEGAFADCGITSINIPKNVKKIAREAFLGCQALTKINITKATTDISPEAFKQCTQLTEINVDRDNAKYTSIDGYLLSKNKTELMIFPPGKANDRFTLLPPSITKIGDFAFYDCKKLKNVTIPNKVKSIGKRAFGLCDNLNTITFLCDEVIGPGFISQGGNDAAFDADKGPQKKMGKIVIYVRKSKLGDYQTTPFYKKFAMIAPSFTTGTEEYIAVSEKTVALLSSTNTNHTFVLPTQITFGPKHFDVSYIGDYAFENISPNVKEVVVKRNVAYIGAKAFVTSGNTLQSVFFIESSPSKEMLSTTRFELDATEQNYNEFASGTKIYVKKSAYGLYMNAWKKMVYNTTTKKEEPSQYDFTSQIDYRIKDVNINTKYATFAREFDVDFGDCLSENGSRVAAFVSGSQIKFGSPDYGDAMRRIRMKSIDLNGGVPNSYGYIPANTGVLLKVIGKESATNASFYYTIGEKDNVKYNISSNVMIGVTEKPRKLLPVGQNTFYVMQGGTFRRVNTVIQNFPVHKAFLRVKKVAGAKLILQFDDEELVVEGEETTGIEGVTTDENKTDDDGYYNLNGQRVTNPQKGIYIHRGKKVIFK